MPSLMLLPMHRLRRQWSLIDILLKASFGMIIAIPNLMTTTIIINKPKSLPLAIPMSRIIVIRVPRLTRPHPALVLLGRTDGGIVPPIVEMALIAVPTNALATVPDEEEAACAQGYKDDYEAQDWEGDDHAQVDAVGGVCAWRGEGHGGGEEDFGEDSGRGDVECGAHCCAEVAVISNGFEDWDKVSGCSFFGFVDSSTVCKIHLPTGCARVHGLGGQVIAELAGVNDVIGKCSALAPVLEVVRAGVCQVDAHS